jgi:hypothetical protein
MPDDFIQIVPPLHFVEADAELDCLLRQHGVSRQEIESGLREDAVRWFDGSRKRYMLLRSTFEKVQALSLDAGPASRSHSNLAGQ